MGLLLSCTFWALWVWNLGTVYPGPLAQGLPQTAVSCQPGLCSHVKTSPAGEEGCAPKLTLVEPSSFLAPRASPQDSSQSDSWLQSRPYVPAREGACSAEVTVFYNLVSEWHPVTFVVISSLEAGQSLGPAHTQERVIQGMNTWSWGHFRRLSTPGSTPLSIR